MSERNRPSLVWLTAIALALIASYPQQSAAAPPRSANHISVTTYFSDTDTGGNPSTIASDGGGAYQDNTVDGHGVMSILTENGYNGIPWGDWQFDSNNSTTRSVSRVFNEADGVLPGDPHYTAPANPPFSGAQNLKSRVQVKCTLLNRSMLTMTAGSSFTCPMPTTLDTAGNVRYRLDPAPSWSGYAETTDVLITCNTAESDGEGWDGCNDWFIDPIGGPGQAVGRLTHQSVQGKPKTFNDGDFYMKFHVHITRP